MKNQLLLPTAILFATMVGEQYFRKNEENELYSEKETYTQIFESQCTAVIVTGQTGTATFTYISDNIVK